MNAKGLIYLGWVTIVLLLLSWAVLYAQQAPPQPPRRPPNLLAVCHDARDQATLRFQIVDRHRDTLEVSLATSNLALLKSRDEIKRLVSKISKMEFEQTQKEKEAETEEAKTETETPQADTQAVEPETEGLKPETATEKLNQ